MKSYFAVTGGQRADISMLKYAHYMHSTKSLKSNLLICFFIPMPFHHSFHHCTKEPAVANGFVLRTAGYRVGDILKYLFGYDMMKKKRERKKKIEMEDKEN